MPRKNSQIKNRNSAEQQPRAVEASKRQKRHEVFFMIVLTVAIITFSVLFAIFLYYLSERDMFSYLEGTEHLTQPQVLLFIFITYFLFSLVVSLIVFLIIYYLCIDPFYKLSSAIYRVENNDYSVKLSVKHRFGFVGRTYRNFDSMCEKLQSVTGMQNDFIAMVSHEIKTPISVINGYIWMLKDEKLPQEEKKKYIDKITDAASELSTMTEDILMLSRFENQKYALDEEFFNLPQQLRRILQLMEGEWEAKNLHINLALEDINIYGDQSVIYHVWRNIISNAVKFTDVDGSISISCKKIDDNSVEVSVIDTGCGMDDEVLEHIFEKFYRADSSHKVSGNGLGLPLTKRILDVIGGEIKISSIPDKGSNFTVVLHNCYPVLNGN